MIVRQKGKSNLRLFEATMDGVETYFLNSSLNVYLENAKVQEG